MMTMAPASKPLSFKQLLKQVTDCDKGAALLKTAANTGWLSNGVFFTRLTAEEQQKVKEVTDKRQEPLDLSDVLPQFVGITVAKYKASDGAVKLTSQTGKISASVDAELFFTLKKRHPNANIYFSEENPENSPIIFSEKNTVGMLVSVMPSLL